MLEGVFLVQAFLHEQLLDSHGDDGADEVDELRRHDAVVGVDVHRVPVNDSLVHAEHHLDVPALVIRLVCQQGRDVGLGAEHDKAEGPLLVIIGLLREGPFLLGLLHVGYLLFRGEPRIAEGVKDNLPRGLDLPVHHGGVLEALERLVGIVHAVFRDELGVELERDEVVKPVLLVDPVKDIPVVKALVEDHQASPYAVRLDEVPKRGHVYHVPGIRPRRNRLHRFGVERIQEAHVFRTLDPGLPREARERAAFRVEVLQHPVNDQVPAERRVRRHPVAHELAYE